MANGTITEAEYNALPRAKATQGSQCCPYRGCIGTLLSAWKRTKDVEGQAKKEVSLYFCDECDQPFRA